MSSLFESLVGVLSSKGIPYEIIEHDEIAGVDDGAALLNIPAETILKTIGFSAGDRYVFAVLPARQHIDCRKLARELKIGRDRLRALSASVIESELGYQTGGLSPIHVSDKVSVFVDSEAAKLGTVFCGIGVRNRTLRISSEGLILASGATLLDLVKHEGQ